MANPVDISDSVRDAYGRAAINGSVSATYVRQGKTISITIAINVVSGGGQYYSVHVNNNDFALSETTGTVTKTYSYNDPGAKTYSFDIWIYLQTAAQVNGYTYTKGPLTIDVPAAGDTVLLNVGGAWKKANATWMNVGGVWKQAEAIKTNTGGNWQ